MLVSRAVSNQSTRHSSLSRLCGATASPYGKAAPSDDHGIEGRGTVHVVSEVFLERSSSSGPGMAAVDAEQGLAVGGVVLRHLLEAGGVEALPAGAPAVDEPGVAPLEALIAEVRAADAAALVVCELPLLDAAADRLLVDAGRLLLMLLLLMVRRGCF